LETRSGSARELILSDMNIDCQMQRPGTDIGCLARNGERAASASNGDAAIPGALGAGRGILVVVGAVVEAFAAHAAPADGRRNHVATAVPVRGLKCFAPATTRPPSAFVGQSKDHSHPHWEVSAVRLA
jgi:hypothetical protein